MAKPPPASQLLLWLLLAAPGIVLSYLYATDVYTYGKVLHLTGDWSAQLLIVTLAITPLRLAFPRSGAVLWLVRRRRDLGVAMFGYAAFHLVAYLIRKQMPAIILAEGRELDILTGWIAFLVFAVLAATSNDVSVRILKLAWKRLHRLVYPAAALMFAHWLLTAFDPARGAMHAAILIALEATRIALQRRRRAAR